MSRPSCYNRPAFKHFTVVPIGWTVDGKRDTAFIPDSMSKGCKQHGPMGEATLHPEAWDCVGCEWKPEKLA